MRPGPHTGGTPITSLGPGGLCPDLGDCGTWYGAIDDLPDLADCLRCLGRELVARTNSRVAAGPVLAVSPKCSRSLYSTILKAMRKGRKQISKCAQGGVQPFACPLDDDPEDKFGRELTKFAKKIAKCTDAQGIPGSLLTESMNDLCRDGPFLDESDLADCYADTARCLACQYGNLAFNQGQDCTEFAGVDCRATTPATAPLYVVNAGNETVTFFNGTPAPAFGTLAASSFPTGAGPAAVFASDTARFPRHRAGLHFPISQITK